MGFAIALQLSILIAKDKLLNNFSEQSGRPLIVLVQLIYSVTGISGAFGFAWLIGHVEQFKGPIFIIGICIGIAFFLLTAFLSDKLEN